MSKIIRSCGTHDGSFHADEVSACALLILFDCIDFDKITRSRDPKVLATCQYVCDVGGIYDPSQGLFDHHQAHYDGELSSAGMILQFLRDQKKISLKEHEAFSRYIIKGVDDHDQGKDPSIYGVCTFSHVIANFNTIHHEAPAEEQHKAFFKALEFTFGHLRRFWERYQYIISCREIVAEAMRNDTKVLMFEKSIPWQDVFFDLGGEKHPAQFIIMPSGEHWKLRGIPPNDRDRMAVRMPMPQSWAGLLQGDLKKVTGIEDAVFCHKGRFISVWKTREAALRALELINGGGNHDDSIQENH